MRWWRQSSAFGELLVVMSDVGLVRLSLPAPSGAGALDIESLDDGPEPDPAVATQLDEYFAGTRRVFTVPVDWMGAEGFGRAVVDTLARDVPYGETVSYGELAEMVGSPRAARAVGNVMAHCPISVVVPCHRVVASGNRLGRYGPGGGTIKRALLELEGVHLPD
jgi:methylated-DNA-[protein]-cysteine S-methyltransferase